MAFIAYKGLVYSITIDNNLHISNLSARETKELCSILDLNKIDKIVITNNCTDKVLNKKDVINMVK